MNSIFKGKSNLNTTHRICLSGLFVALVAILQKIAAINYLPGIPYFRISLGGPSLIIYSSICLGPFYGALVGGLSDVVGYFMFDASSFPWMFQITLIYIALGFFPYYIFEFINKIKDSKKLVIGESIFLGALLASIIVYITLFFDCSFIFKIALPIAISILYICLCLFVFLYKGDNNFYGKYNFSFSLLLIEILVMLLFGVLMKCWAFNVFYKIPFAELFGIIFISQSVSCIFNVFFNTLTLTAFIRVSKKYFVSGGDSND